MELADFVEMLEGKNLLTESADPWIPNMKSQL